MSRQKQLTEPLMSSTSYEDGIIEDRNRAVKEVAQDIAQLHEIMVDLNSLVVEQGTDLEQVNANVETADVYTNLATDELAQALQHQNKSRRKMCYISILLILLIIAIIIVILVVTGAFKK
eukprot:TRINITY_DN2641_c0_g1_i1.p1 TRINITY_DN2641_c0_g1~~TRINITY_DN2641_c0_g1_i1.p1  ORF type:complete len:120 (+),score=15.54 TRINITY_DN2641_c0_g1_i1:307-666(+)